MEKEFNYENFEREAIEQLRAGRGALGKDGVLTPLLKRFLEKALQSELDLHLAETKEMPNRRNGKGSKRVRSSVGSFDLETPRDRQGSFEPEIVKKREVFLGEDLEEKIIRLYARGMSYEDIRGHLQEMYGLEISAGKLSQITDKILPELESWRVRPLESLYVIVYLDAIHFKVRENGQVQTKALYNAMGVKKDGHKELLGLYLSASEGAKFWLSVLSDLQNRGVKDILIACIDNMLSIGKEAKP